MTPQISPQIKFLLFIILKSIKYNNSLNHSLANQTIQTTLLTIYLFLIALRIILIKRIIYTLVFIKFHSQELNLYFIKNRPTTRATALRLRTKFAVP